MQIYAREKNVNYSVILSYLIINLSFESFASICHTHKYQHKASKYALRIVIIIQPYNKTSIHQL